MKNFTYFFTKMKTQIKPIKEETSLFENSEEVIKLLNKDDFNKYDFSYKKLQTIIPLFKSIKFGVFTPHISPMSFKITKP